ncbi:MAG: hypothetical protein WCD72_05715 [Dehalococcoidia bacterium]
MQQKKDRVGKTGSDTKGRAPQTKPDKLSKWVSYAHIATPVVSILILIVAAWGARTAYNDFLARARPYLAIEQLKFNKATDNSTWILIDMTNMGERPATGINIQDVSVCVVPSVSCTQIHWTPIEDQKDTIVFPHRINEIRISITQNDYQYILTSEKLVVNLQYRFGDKEYYYKATMTLQTDSNEWIIESHQGD